MQEGDVLSFRAKTRLVVDQTDSGSSAAVEGSCEVIHGKAHMVNARPAFRDESPDGRVGLCRLEQLDEGFTSGKTSCARAIGIIERDEIHS